MGVWILAFLPVLFVGGFVVYLMASGVNPEIGEISGSVRFLITIVQAVLDTFVSLVTTVAMVYGLQDLFRRMHEKK